MTDAPPTPGHTLRIGVTGTRTLNPEQLYFLRPRVDAILCAVARLAAGSGGKPALRLLSPLAEGADRLVAACALNQGYELVCPMPFPQLVYEEDFDLSPGSLAEFHRLLAHAEGRILALDGARDTPKYGLYAEARSYQAVGRLIVRNCDLIIGIWDGRPGQGPGGTADTIHYAAAAGPPVIWLHATDGRAEPRWIEGAHDLRHNATPKPVDEPLQIYLGRLLSPPHAAHHGGAHGILHTCGHWLGRRRAVREHADTPISHLDLYLHEQPEPVWAGARPHGWFMRTMAGGKAAPGSPRHAPHDTAARRWFDRYEPADARAGDNAACYRSSYVWVFALGAAALIAAAVSLGIDADHLGNKFLATLAEFIALGLIALFVILDGKLAWHRRSIEYRLLAELCRKQQALAPLAWVVPRASAWADTAPSPEREPDAPYPQGTSWVAWLFSAWLRDTPLPTGTIDPAWVSRAKAAAQSDLLKDQIDYHTARRAQAYRASQRLVWLGEVGFFVVGFVVFCKLYLLWHLLGSSESPPQGFIHLLGLAGAILPAIAAALVGIRFYAELELLAEQSDTMLIALRRANRQITELDPNEPLASQALGGALAGVALLMLEDLDGWARLFRGKVLDA